MKNNTKFVLYDIVLIGVMAAVCFVTTMFLKFDIPTPTGPTMIKTANIFCLLAGMLLGGVKGGLAAGLGSFLYDLTNPAYIAESPITFFNFFMMGLVCGLIFHLAEKSKTKTMFVIWSVVAALGGQVAYFILRFTKDIGRLMLAGSTFEAAFAGNSVKMISSLINMAISVPCAVLLVPVLITALKKANVYQKIHRQPQSAAKLAESTVE